MHPASDGVLKKKLGTKNKDSKTWVFLREPVIDLYPDFGQGIAPIR
jgi:hypothetical protein